MAFVHLVVAGPPNFRPSEDLLPELTRLLAAEHVIDRQIEPPAGQPPAALGPVTWRIGERARESGIDAASVTFRASPRLFPAVVEFAVTCHACGTPADPGEWFALFREFYATDLEPTYTCPGCGTTTPLSEVEGTHDLKTATITRCMLEFRGDGWVTVRVDPEAPIMERLRELFRGLQFGQVTG